MAMTNYAQFIVNPILTKQAEEFANTILRKSPLKVEFSAKTIRCTRVFHADSITERLTRAYVDVSFNSPLMAKLAFVLMQRGMGSAGQKYSLWQIDRRIGGCWKM